MGNSKTISSPYSEAKHKPHVRMIIENILLYKVCKCNVSNDEISRFLVIIAHYREPVIVNNAQRFRKDGVEHLLLIKLYQQYG